MGSGSKDLSQTGFELLVQARIEKLAKIGAQTHTAVVLPVTAPSLLREVNPRRDRNSKLETARREQTGRPRLSKLKCSLKEK